VDAVVTGAPEIPGLRDRSLDLVLSRMRPLAELHFADDLNVEVLFDEQLAIVAGMQSPWARRRRIDLADLADEPWLLTSSQNWNYVMVAEAFAARGLKMPR
jgi:DNA-binding transcriptional LysR family regulator